MKLSDMACRKAVLKDKDYKLSDGGGLYLLVKKNGSKLWRLKYRFFGREKTLSIGPYPNVSLNEARNERDAAKKLLAETPPIDPSFHKRETKAAAQVADQDTFIVIALEWFEKFKDTWSHGYQKKIMNLLNNDIFPTIGHRPIDLITPPELLRECLQKIEARGSLEIAGRAKNYCSRIFTYGIQTGKCQWNPAANLDGAITPHSTKHFRAFSIEDVPAFIEALEKNDARLYASTRRAVWLSLYTFCRPVEIRKARLAHVNVKESIWKIPGEMMKMKRDHIVPLSRQALNVVKEQARDAERFRSEWLFPSVVRPKNPMSDGTVNKAIRLLGFGEKSVAHGFRALARTTIREKLRYDSEIIEKQLAHKSKGALGEAYDRTQFLEEREKMMQDWADLLDQLRP